MAFRILVQIRIPILCIVGDCSRILYEYRDTAVRVCTEARSCMIVMKYCTVGVCRFHARIRFVCTS